MHLQVKAWRRALHAWDHGDPTNPAPAQPVDGEHPAECHQPEGAAAEAEDDDDIVPLAALEEINADECVQLRIFSQMKGRGYTGFFRILA
jgi:hypothetical protein